jgi:hypothetical protein
MVLDGVDELLAQRGERSVRDWFERLFADPQFGSTRVLLCGRDEAFSEGQIYADFEETLRARVLKMSGGRGQSMARFSLKPWALGDKVGALEELLPPGQALQTLILPLVVQSQLLFGLAYSWLATADRSAATVPIRSEWQLIRHFLDRILLDQGKYGARRMGDRRRVVQGLSLFLALSGAGTSGISLAKLRKDPALALLWRQIESIARNGGKRGNPLAYVAFSLMLKAPRGNYAPFHPQILTHLAAEALVEIIERDDILLPRTNGKVPPVLGRVWSSLAGWLDQPGLLRLLPFVRRHIEPQALLPRSELDQVMRYWARQVPASEASPLVLPSLEGFSELGEQDRLALEAAILLRDAAAGLVRTPVAGLAAPQGAFAPVPAGRIVVWAWDERGQRHLEERVLNTTVYLARRLVTVAEYAEFLRDPSLATALSADDLPRMPEAGWRLDGAIRVVFDPVFEDAPVTGVGYQWALRYARWFTLKHGALVEESLGESGLRFDVPPHDVLLAATGGVRFPLGRQIDRGPHGHDGLIGERWQLTSTIEDGERRVFGGSTALGSDPEGIGKVVYERLREYSLGQAIDARDRHTGIRLFAEKHIPVDAQTGGRQQTGGRGSGSGGGLLQGAGGMDPPPDDPLTTTEVRIYTAFVHLESAPKPPEPDPRQRPRKKPQPRRRPRKKS